MTEAEWLAGPGPVACWEPLKGQVSERKHRLYVCGVCRVLHPRMYTSVQKLLDLADRYADGQVGWEELAAAEHTAVSPLTPRVELAAQLAVWALHPHAGKASGNAVWSIQPDGYTSHTNLVRCLFGNLFRPVAFDPDWRTPSAVALAAGIYADRDFAHLPVLADALEDAGCVDADILGHCRGGGPHVRGCWVVDLVLGKE